MANGIDDGVKLTAGATPFTDKLPTKGLPAAEAVTETVPFEVPVAIGEAVTLIEQFAPAPKDAGQLLDCPKLDEATMLDIVAALPPAFVRVITVGPEELPTTTS